MFLSIQGESIDKDHKDWGLVTSPLSLASMESARSARPGPTPAGFELEEDGHRISEKNESSSGSKIVT